jgi:hypothetical protein
MSARDDVSLEPEVAEAIQFRAKFALLASECSEAVEDLDRFLFEFRRAPLPALPRKIAPEDP